MEMMLVIICLLTFIHVIISLPTISINQNDLKKCNDYTIKHNQILFNRSININSISMYDANLIVDSYNKEVVPSINHIINTPTYSISDIIWYILINNNKQLISIDNIVNIVIVGDESSLYCYNSLLNDIEKLSNIKLYQTYSIIGNIYLIK